MHLLLATLLTAFAAFSLAKGDLHRDGARWRTYGQGPQARDGQAIRICTGNGMISCVPTIIMHLQSHFARESYPCDCRMASSLALQNSPRADISGIWQRLNSQSLIGFVQHLSISLFAVDYASKIPRHRRLHKHLSIHHDEKNRPSASQTRTRRRLLPVHITRSCIRTLTGEP